MNFWVCVESATEYILHMDCYPGKRFQGANVGLKLLNLQLHDPKKVNWNLKLNFMECPIIKHLILSPDSLWKFWRRRVCEDFDAGPFV